MGWLSPWVWHPGPESRTYVAHCLVRSFIIVRAVLGQLIFANFVLRSLWAQHTAAHAYHDELKCKSGQVCQMSHHALAAKETAKDDGGGGEGQGEARQLDALREELESLAMPVALLQTLVDMQITTVEQLFQSFTVDQMKTAGMNIGQRNRLVRRSKQRTGL